MKAPLYVEILDNALHLSIRDVFPDGYCHFMQEMTQNISQILHESTLR